MSRALLLIVSFLAVGPATGWAQSKAAKAPIQDPKSTVKQAEELFLDKEYGKVTDLLWKNISSLNRQGFILLMKAHKEKKEWGEVIRASNLALSKNAKDEEAMTYLGEAQFRRANKPTEAKETLKKVLEINPKYQPAYEILAQIYEKNPYEQRIIYQDMVEVFGPKASFLSRLCALNANDGENEQGEKYCQEAIAASPKVPDNHVYLGIIAKQKGDLEKSKKLLTTAANQFNDSEFAQYEAAAFLESDKAWIESNKYYEKCTKADDKSDRCWLGVGNSAIQLRNYDRALYSFIKACQIAGRKSAPIVRRAASAVRQRKDVEWSDKLSRVADRCSYL
ncbi:MAG: hypothetical protein KF789_04155 [Bdellovibrionaceae bacterium]|nr:hypothetical protein [Pseudobdellovibrionaceae bacterium]